MTDMERMQELIELLNRAAKAYYQEADEIMSNFEYDRLYDELLALEEKLHVQMTNSPTNRVGYEILSELPKERHESPMLSLDKTKAVEDLESFIGEQKALISWKLDGLTIVLTYAGGELMKAVTRGNGEIGEVITPNAKVFKNVPLKIPFTGDLVLRGEAVISYSDFEKINAAIADVDARYKNPRNLCSGSVRQLNSKITAERSVRFYAFNLVSAEGVDFANSRKAQFDFLQDQGFDVVEHYMITRDTVADRVKYFAKAIETMDIPSDGLVLTLEDLAYSASLGRTAKYPRDSYAFKWADETADTVLREIEWSPSRTGLINPVAIFDSVDLEGTSVSRASVHNVSILKSMKLGIGDTIRVFKANMIIPQIAENLTQSGTVEIPCKCPACGGETRINRLGDVETLYCENPECPVKQLKAFSLFVSRDAMNIAGMSEATLEKFLGHGFIKEFADLYHLEEHKEAIVGLEGFGEKSYEKLIGAIDKARATTLSKVIYSLGIANIGLATAKLITKACDYDVEKIRQASAEELGAIDKVGPVIAQACEAYFADEKNNAMLDRLLAELTLESEVSGEEQSFSGMTFVITGSVHHYANRNEIKAVIESRGGKVAGSVSAKTNYLINNDSASKSSKNQAAQKLGIPILTEEDFMAML